MGIDYRHTCDRCGKSLIEDGTEIFCADCFAELVDRIEELEEEIENLNRSFYRKMVYPPIKYQLLTVRAYQDKI